MPDIEITALWSREPAPGDDLLILLHGFEGTERDLEGRFPGLPDSVVQVSLRAPIEQAGGAAWFLDDYGVRDAADGILAWLDTQPALATVGVLGLSQGGAMALELLRAAPERFAYVVQLSGIILDVAAAPRVSSVRPPVFSGHGTLDEIVPRDAVVATNAWLAEHPELTGRSYDGMGHWISAHEAEDVVTFIDGIIGATAEHG
jgi:phospholipase/carboxylesterase